MKLYSPDADKIFTSLPSRLLKCNSIQKCMQNGRIGKRISTIIKYLPNSLRAKMSIRVNLNDHLFYAISMRSLQCAALHRFPNGVHSHDAAVTRQTTIYLISICSTYSLSPFLLYASLCHPDCTCEMYQIAGYIPLIASVDCRASLHICGGRGLWLEMKSLKSSVVSTPP